MLLGGMLLDVNFEVVEGVRVGGEGRLPLRLPESVCVLLEIIHLIYKLITMEPDTPFLNLL